MSRPLSIFFLAVGFFAFYAGCAIKIFLYENARRIRTKFPASLKWRRRDPAAPPRRHYPDIALA